MLPSEGEPAVIEVVHGDGQSGRVGEPLGQPVVVQVTDGRGRAVAGATVAFELTSAGPNTRIAPDTATTDANGEANAQITLGTTTGTQKGEARLVTGGGGVFRSAPFTAIAVPENANSMAAVGGEDQTGQVGTPLDEPLVVQVTDAFGNPISGVPISWEAEGGGTVSENTVRTDKEGKASVQRVLGPATGEQATIATSSGLAGSPVTFIHTALAGNASRVAIVSGDNQTGQVGSQLPAELVVRLVDGEGNGVPNTAVAWVVATGGGRATPTSSITDQEGRASARWTLGATPGPNRLDAVVSGVGVVSFDATATAGAPAALALVTQPAASAQNGIKLVRQPVIQLRDAGGNPVGTAGIAISAAIGTGSGTLSGTRQRITDGNGRASFTDLAISGASGRYTLVFSSAGYASVTSDGITVGAISTTTTITRDTPDPSVAGAVVTVEFRVASAGPTPSGSVTVTAIDGGPSCTGELSGGAGSCQITMNVAGNRTLRAEYSGAPGFDPSSDTEAHRVDQPTPDNRPPHADYNWHCEGLTCQFTDGSSDPDGSIAGRSWNFGDGSAAVQDQNPTHTYSGPGEYTVVLTVTDDKGATDVSSARVRVSAPQPEPNKKPKADFDVSCADLTCTVTDKSKDDDGSVVAWHWDFGDGTSADGQSPPPHSYGSGGEYSISLTVTDNRGDTDSRDRRVKVEPPRNQPPTAGQDGPFTTAEDTPLHGDLLGNDSDPEGRPLTAELVAGTAHGTVTVQSNGAFDYTPAADYFGGDSFTYRARDDQGAPSNNVTVAISVTPVNDAPVAGNDNFSTQQDVPLSISFGSLLANDRDPDGDPLGVVNVSSPEHGSLSSSGDGLLYTPETGYEGADSFFYQASDGSAGSAPATVTITVTPAAPPPDD